jgi:hypothetical protein
MCLPCCKVATLCHASLENLAVLAVHSERAVDCTYRLTLDGDLLNLALTSSDSELEVATGGRYAVWPGPTLWLRDTATQANNSAQDKEEPLHGLPPQPQSPDHNLAPL